jgi:hypothetical protein
LKILVACEESQAVTTELRKLGHEAWSCDIEPCSGGHPEWHLRQDVIPLLSERWDMIIAHPPCTYLSNAANRAYSLRMNPPEKVEERLKKREQAIAFFMEFANADCPKIAIENPLGCIGKYWRKADQMIQPYQFGDNAQKRTCLWLKGLPKLKPTLILPKPDPLYICQGEKSKGKPISWNDGMKGVGGGQKGRSRARSKTFPGIARAMAFQWTRGGE